MKASDEQLVADYLEGDERALGTLVDRHMKGAYRFALSIVHDDPMAADVVQESFLKAWKHMRRFVPGNSFRSWLFAIIRNSAIDALRAKREIALSRLSTSDDDSTVDFIPDDQPLPDELIARAQDESYVAALLAKINPQYAEVLHLRHTSNMTFEAIAVLVRRPLHTVKSQYRRGIASLRRLAGARPLSR